MEKQNNIYKQEFRLQKLYGVNWLGNNPNKNGAQRMITDSKAKHTIATWLESKKYGRLCSELEGPEFLKLIRDNNSNICEIISHYPYKVYFDIDGKPENGVEKPSNYMSTITNKINLVFPEADMAVSGSETSEKKSYHIILNNYMVNNEQEREKLKDVINYLKNNFDDGFDTTVYTKHAGAGRLMKTIHQSKLKDKGIRSQEIIINDNEGKHIITAFFNEHVKTINDIKFDDAITTHLFNIEMKKPIDMGKEPKMKLKMDIETLQNIENLTALELLNKTPLTKKHTHIFTFRAMLFCFHNGVSFDSYLEWYKQKNNSNEKARSKKQQWQTMGQFPPLTIYTYRMMLSYYYPEFRTLKGTIKFNNLIDTRAYTNIKIIDRIEPINFIESSRYKFSVFFMGMGNGKTEQMLMYLKTQPTKKFLFIIPNVSLGVGVYKRIKEYGIQIEHYDEDYRAKSKTHKSKYQMKEADNLICCINSLHYLQNNKYDYVIIDEIETVNNKWFDNDTLNKRGKGDTILNSRTAWETYLRLLKDASRVFLLDAFITNTTLKFIESIEPNNYIIFKKNIEMSERKMVVIPEKKQWLAKIINQMNDNKKVFIFYPFKDGTSKNISMEELKQTIEKATNKTGVSYNADTDDKILKELKDVNEHWKDYNFVITNSKITVGINYDDIVNIFDAVFISIASFSACRDVIQASCRPRHLKSNNVFVNFIDNMNSNMAFTGEANLFKKDECKIYYDMVQNIQTEKTAPLKSTFYAFCKMAGYAPSTVEINSELDIELDTLFENIDISYDTIKNISYNQSLIHQAKIADHQAETFEKVETKKYFFNKKFVDEEDELIKYAWNKKFNKFFEQLEKLAPYLQEINIFDEIKEANGWESIFPDTKQLNKVKLTPEIIDTIFDGENWAFTRLKKTSGAKVILRTMYNTWFGKTVIESKMDDNKNSTLEFNDDVIEMYEFGMANLKAYNRRARKPQSNNIKASDGLDAGLDEFID